MSTEILVVDDDPEVRHLLRTCFEREGYIVSEACDAVGARTALERSGIGLVTLDLTLGRDDGLTLAREICAAGDVPIVMVSGKGDAVDRNRRARAWSGRLYQQAVQFARSACTRACRAEAT